MKKYFSGFPSPSAALKSAGHLACVEGVMPVYLILGATWRCNARCITCFNHDMLNDAVEKELSIDEHRRCAASIGHIAWLLFTGGEPILRDDLDELAAVYYEICGARRITIPTNALLPEKTRNAVRSILERCPSGRIAVSLAVDGVSETHDQIRGVPGAFDKLIETYRLLADIKQRNNRLSINLNTVLMNRNIAAIPALMEYVPKNMPDADFHGFELLRGNAPHPGLAPPSPDQYERLLDRLLEYWKKFPFYRGPFRRLIRAAKIDARRMELDVLRGKSFRCRAGDVVGYVSPEGKVYFCEDLKDSVGDLRESNYDFRKIWRGEKAEQLRRRIRETKCSCTHSCFVGSSIIFDYKRYLPGRIAKEL